MAILFTIKGQSFRVIGKVYHVKGWPDRVTAQYHILQQHTKGFLKYKWKTIEQEQVELSNLPCDQWQSLMLKKLQSKTHQLFN